MNEAIRNLIFEVCNDFISRARMPITAEVEEACMRSTGDRDKYPNPLTALVRLALEEGAGKQEPVPVAWRYWEDKFGCWEYSDCHLSFPSVPAGTRMIPLYASDLAPESVPDVDELAQFIRYIDGANTLGAGALAEQIVGWLAAKQTKVPDDVVRDASRYRWLRDFSVPPHQFYMSVPDEFANVRCTRHEVDAYIDAALLSSIPKLGTNHD
jgi:hypothetical protein